MIKLLLCQNLGQLTLFDARTSTRQRILVCIIYERRLCPVDWVDTDMLKRELKATIDIGTHGE